MPTARRSHAAFLGHELAHDCVAKEIAAVLEHERRRELLLTAAAVLARHLLPRAAHGVDEVAEQLLEVRVGEELHEPRETLVLPLVLERGSRSGFVRLARPLRVGGFVAARALRAGL